MGANSKQKRLKRRRVPAAIFYINPKTSRRKQWKSGPPPADKEGKPLSLFDVKGKKVRKPAAKNKRTAKLSIVRLPSADHTASVNRRKIVSLSRSKKWELFWLRAAVIKPGEKDIIWIGTGVYLKPITTRIANAMLRDVAKRAMKSGESLIAIDLIRRPKFKKK